MTRLKCFARYYFDMQKEPEIRYIISKRTTASRKVTSKFKSSWIFYFIFTYRSLSSIVKLGFIRVCIFSYFRSTP